MRGSRLIRLSRHGTQVAFLVCRESSIAEVPGMSRRGCRPLRTQPPDGRGRSRLHPGDVKLKPLCREPQRVRARCGTTASCRMDDKYG